jgi:cation diffusion facilitator CzcD-associated flavoprotein CzcO
MMPRFVEVAIIGAGPYGLSLAAHLSHAGVSFRIFGKPLSTWRHHMPKGMHLNSDGFASNISSPDASTTLKAWCEKNGVAYGDQAAPVELETFNAYASWFQKHAVPSLEELNVTSLSRYNERYTLVLENGERVEARHVVLAVGITWFAHLPEALRGLNSACVTHSFAHHDLSQFKGKDVIVLGAGASAIDTAALAEDAGAKVSILARADHIRFHSAPDPDDASFLKQLQRPSTGIGPGWRSFFCANTPLLFHRMPENLRLRATKNHLGPAPGWFMRERVEGKIPVLLGHALKNARAYDKRVTLDVVDALGKEKLLSCDHVIAATGYKPDLTRLPFLEPFLRSAILQVEHTPVLSDHFETSADGLYVIGPAAANAFGPLMRFMVGAEFVAPRLTGHLRRKIGSRFAKAA